MLHQVTQARLGRGHAFQARGLERPVFPGLQIEGLKPFVAALANHAIEAALALAAGEAFGDQLVEQGPVTAHLLIGIVLG